jgi:hypothetical protein
MKWTRLSSGWNAAAVLMMIVHWQVVLPPCRSGLIYNASTMIHCADGHLFCRNCVRTHADVAVGSRQKVYIPISFFLIDLRPGPQDILCMDSSGCKQPFPLTELQKCLKRPTFELWQKIAQEEDIAAAQIEGLEHCPKCEFCIIFEVGMDVVPVLVCLRSECRFVSCRGCKKKVYIFSITFGTGINILWKAHTGKSCKDVEDAEQVVQEAMSMSIFISV